MQSKSEFTNDKPELKMLNLEHGECKSSFVQKLSKIKRGLNPSWQSMLREVHSCSRPVAKVYLLVVLPVWTEKLGEKTEKKWTKFDKNWERRKNLEEKANVKKVLSFFPTNRYSWLHYCYLSKNLSNCCLNHFLWSLLFLILFLCLCPRAAANQPNYLFVILHDSINHLVYFFSIH